MNIKIKCDFIHNTLRLLAAIALITVFAGSGHAFDFPFGGKNKDNLGNLKKLINIGKKTAKAFEATNLTPEQEHYVGRSVAATVLASYKPLQNDSANRYLNLLGQTLAKFSDRPETFGGYRFMLLDSDEVNGFATPGGFIFITRGLAQCCANEDQLAAALAHEIAHVQYKHGLRSIRTKRLAPIASELLSEALDNGGKLKEVVSVFSGSVDDVADKLLNSKYSRETEKKADETALIIMRRCGYNPAEFIGLLDGMSKRFRSVRGGFYNTHPSPRYRQRFVTQLLGKNTQLGLPPAGRMNRFSRFLESISGR